jgi:hypothetical protein
VQTSGIVDSRLPPVAGAHLRVNVMLIPPPTSLRAEVSRARRVSRQSVSFFTVFFMAVFFGRPAFYPSLSGLTFRVLPGLARPLEFVRHPLEGFPEVLGPGFGARRFTGERLAMVADLAHPGLLGQVRLLADDLWMLTPGVCHWISAFPVGHALFSWGESWLPSGTS